MKWEFEDWSKMTCRNTGPQSPYYLRESEKMSPDPLKILLVDDDLQSSLLLQKGLAEASAGLFEVAHAERLDEGLRQLEEEAFDAVLLDMSLPDSRGLETFFRLHRACPSVPVVVLTGVDDDALALQAVQAGAQDYLVKGQVGSPLLVRALRYAVERFALHTELEERTAKLRENEEIFRAISTSAQDAILMMDEAGGISYWNDAAEKIFGYAREEVLGQDLHILLAPRRFHEAYRQGFARFRTTGGGPVVGQTLELTSVRKDGTEFPIELSLAAVKLEDRWQAIGILRDITERRQAEEMLRESEAHFQRMATHLEDVLYSVDGETQEFLYLSPAFEKLLGYTGEDIRQMGGRQAFLDQVIQQGGFSDQQCTFDRLQKGQEVDIPDGYETWWRCKDGSLKCLEDHWLPVYEGGRLLSTDGVLRDITGRKQREEQIRKALAEKEVLLREIYHRVKNNLQVVSSLLYQQATSTQDETLRPILQESRDRIRSMALVHQELYQSDNLEQIGIARYLETLVANLLESYSVEERIVFSSELDDISLNVETAVPLGLIVNELVSNALKYAFPDGRKGQIRIELRRDKGDGYRLIVSDDGIGYQPGPDLQHSTTLGLRLVQDLAYQLGGGVEMRCEGGTVVEVTFSKVE